MNDDIKKLKDKRKAHDEKVKEEQEFGIINLDGAKEILKNKDAKKGIKEMIESVKIEEQNVAVVAVDKVIGTGENFLDKALGFKNWAEEKVYNNLCCPFSCLTSEKKVLIKSVDNKFVDPMRELLNILDNELNWNLVPGPGDRLANHTSYNFVVGRLAASASMVSVSMSGEPLTTTGKA